MLTDYWLSICEFCHQRVEMLLGSNERLINVESRLAQLELLVHHPIDAESTTTIPLVGDQSNSTETEHEVNAIHQHIDQELGTIENEGHTAEKQMLQEQLNNNVAESEFSFCERVVGETHSEGRSLSEGKAHRETTEGQPDNHAQPEGGSRSQSEVSQESHFNDVESDVAESVLGQKRNQDLTNSLERHESF